MSFQQGTTWPEAVRHACELARRTGQRQRVEQVGVANGRRWYWWRNAIDPHPWQEYNAYGNTCHYPGCDLAEDEHPRTPRRNREGAAA